MQLKLIKEFLESNGLELTITELEPADGRANGESGEMPVHTIQYYNKQGQDTIMLVVGHQHRIVAVDGKILEEGRVL